MTDLTHSVANVPEPIPDAEATARPDTLEVGQWFWVTTKRKHSATKTWFGCITHMGSNYAMLEEPHRPNYSGESWRIGYDGFFDSCVWVSNAQEVIDGYTLHHNSRLHHLMGELKAATARLAIAPQRELYASGSETQALSTTLSGQSYDDYKGALVKAQKEELPAIFKQIEAEHEQLAKWMSAALVPLRAQAGSLSVITKSIESRIFNVELYAGLSEQIVEVKDGEPAGIAEPLTMIQRRHYMDEECLARYECGGMDFSDIKDFDAWISRFSNLERLLPFQRCIVAFRVRRHKVERETQNLSDFIQLMLENEQNMKTYLYIRNGEQLFRMSTAIDFGPHLFPDIDRETLATGVKLWAVYDRGDHKIEALITDPDHTERVNAWNERVARNKKRREDWETARAAISEEERKKDWHKWNWFDDDHGLSFDERHYERFDKSSLYYDDIQQWRQDQIDAHNRIALVIQGLFDRSPVLHPHPPWQIWTAEGYEQAIRLIFDSDRALTVGAAPDFEAYRAKLNKQLKTGSVTIGQDALWAVAEREKEEERREKRGGSYKDRDVSNWWRPHSNPGPGKLATVVSMKKSSGKCVYEWTRKSNKGKKRWEPDLKDPGYGWWRRDCSDIQESFTCEQKELFNVSAYKPGDFRQFFEDPRTRADYMKWAPLLLAAEEWHAGNKDGKPKKKPEPPEQNPCGACGHAVKETIDMVCPMQRDGAVCAIDAKPHEDPTDEDDSDGETDE